LHSPPEVGHSPIRRLGVGRRAPGGVGLTYQPMAVFDHFIAARWKGWEKVRFDRAMEPPQRVPCQSVVRK
jgi:hypothetical protein